MCPALAVTAFSKWGYGMKNNKTSSLVECTDIVRNFLRIAPDDPIHDQVDDISVVRVIDQEVDALLVDSSHWHPYTGMSGQFLVITVPSARYTVNDEEIILVDFGDDAKYFVEVIYDPNKLLREK